MANKTTESSAVREALRIVDAADRLITLRPVAGEPWAELVCEQVREIATAAKKLRPNHLEDVFRHLQTSYSRDVDPREGPDDNDEELRRREAAEAAARVRGDPDGQ